MMPILSTNTADARTSLLLLTSIRDIQGTSLIRTTSPLMMTVSLSAEWDFVCTGMDMRLRSTGQNTAARKQTADGAVSVNNPVPLPDMAGQYIFIPAITQDCLTHRQGILKHGKRNMTQGLPWNAPTNVRKKTIN